MTVLGDRRVTDINSFVTDVKKELLSLSKENGLYYDLFEEKGEGRN